MKKLFYLFLILPFLVASCSDDDNNDAEGATTIKVNPSAVFTGGQLKGIDDMVFTYNSEGLVTKISDGEVNIQFTYGDNVTTRATAKLPSDVIMKYDDGYGDEYASYTIYMKLGDNGFVESCIQMYDGENLDSNMETWSFKYNADGQLAEMKRSEGENETTTITYKDGNIVKVTMVSESTEDDLSFNGTIAYTSDKHKSGIDNKGCIMLFDETFGVDLDEMKYAYYAGILGKATKQLPLQLVDVDDDYRTDFNWTINDKGYPTKVSYYWGGNYTVTFDFKW